MPQKLSLSTVNAFYHGNSEQLYTVDKTASSKGVLSATVYCMHL